MKTPSITTWILVSVFVVACSPSLPTGMVSYVGYSGETLKVKSEGFGQKEVDIESQAAVNAINRLLFEGIVGSSFKEPMITDSGKKSDSFFKELEQGGYRRYITSIQRETQVVQHKGLVRTATYQVSMDVASLRRALEQEGIIRKFGF